MKKGGSRAALIARKDGGFLEPLDDRLDAAALDKALEAERISSAARRRIVAAATVTNKAAVSYTVETK